MQDVVRSGAIYFSRLYMFNFEDLLVKCYWQSNEFECGDAFINHIGETSACFTFNPGKQLAAQLISGKIGNIVIIELCVDTLDTVQYIKIIL